MALLDRHGVNIYYEVAGSGPAIVFTHGHLSRILTTRLVGLQPQAGAVLQNDAASVGVISDKRGQYVIVGWNIRAD